MKARIYYLDWLRVVACLMVMVVHACECIYSNDRTPALLSSLSQVLTFGLYICC